MVSQLSKKAALPLAKILATCRNSVSNTGSWPIVRHRNSPATGEFDSQRPVTQSFGVYFDLTLNKRLSKPSRRRWFETPSWSLWLQCNDDAEASEFSAGMAKEFFSRENCLCYISVEEYRGMQIHIYFSTKNPSISVVKQMIRCICCYFRSVVGK